MDREEGIKFLKGGTGGVAEWNRRRDMNEKIPSLRGADLMHADLLGVNLSNMDLIGAELRGTKLGMANLSGASLQLANLSGADLQKANLSRAHIIEAKFFKADLSWANLSAANLTLTFMNHAKLCGAEFGAAICCYTAFTGVDLSEVTGLYSVNHNGPSSIGADTIFLSKGKIPEAFLRGCGLPETLINHLPSLIGSMSPIQFYSSFISYSAKDTPFAERLYADMQSKGVRCWYAPEDLKIGEMIRVGIDQSIRDHDKLLLILSKNSVESEWVEKEVETAMERERKEKRTVLFPIRLDDAVMNINSGWPADVRHRATSAISVSGRPMVPTRSPSTD